HYLQVTAIDALGNESARSEAGYVVIDLTAPAVPEMLPLPAYTNAYEGALIWTAVDSAVKYEVEYSIAGTPATVTDIPVHMLNIDISLAADGDEVTAKVRAYDAVGNVSDWSDEVSTIVDRTGPVVSAVTTPASPTNNPRPTWEWSGDDDGLSGVDFYIVTLDSELPFETRGTSFTPASNLADGAHVLKVKAVDNVGNVGAEVAFAAVVIDTTPPAVPGMPQTTSPTNNQNPVWTWGAVDDAAKYRVFEDEVDKGFVTEPTYTSSNLPEGTHYLQVTAIDALGNESARSEAGYVVIDTTDPAAPEMTALPEYTNEDSVTFIWSAVTDAVKYDFSYSLDGGATWTTVTGLTVQTYTVDISGAADGDVIRGKVVAYDEAGNESAESNVVSTTVDRTGPVVTIVSPTEPYDTNDTTPTWKWTAADAGVGVKGYWIQIDNDGWKWLPGDGSLAEHTPSSSQSLGAHVLRVKAIDLLGNEGVVVEFPTVTVVLPVICRLMPAPGEYDINLISTIMFMVMNLHDAPVEVLINGVKLDEEKVVEVGKIGNETKFYILLDVDDFPAPVGIELELRVMVVGICVGDDSASYVYTVTTERSGFGFGRLRPW
ncbi:MAG: hypothetical protein NUW23_11065, partial [Firmicutes bacterium]|nr:hypothetical protein [Bacillota bacterium]